jgi:hypothetical protein
MYTVYENYIDVVGYGWYNQPISLTIKLQQHDVENMKDNNQQITRDSIQSWLDCHVRDFQSITDFYALIDNAGIEIPWNKSEDELIDWEHFGEG